MALDRKTKVRLVLFILAFVIAVGSFSYGMLSLGHRESGWYEVDPAPEASAVTYDSGVHLLYYAEGKSGEIRQTINAAQKLFSESLSRYDKLLDARSEYDDAVNIASVSAANGEPVVIGETLYNVLSDALEKTGEAQGYSLFAGALWREWETLLFLDEPRSFDPINNPDEAERLDALAEAINRPGSLQLVLSPENGFTAALVVSSEYRALEEAYELDAPALDLNALREAYLVDLVAKDMTAQGMTAGYLYTDSGLTVLLDGGRDYRLDVYGLEGAPVRVASLSGNEPMVVSQCAAFSTTGDQYGAYAVEEAGETYLRHARFDARTGGFHDVLLNVMLASDKRTAVDLACEGLKLYALDSRDAIETELASQGDTAAVWLFRGEGKALGANASARERLILDEAGGYQLK